MSELASSDAYGAGGERFAGAGAIRLCFQTFGHPDAPALVMIMGLATQMIGWRDRLCLALADAGFFVVRFDNRDVGRSTHLGHLPVPSTWELLKRSRTTGGYSLGDMAGDTIAVADHLGIGGFHVAGASMGGMIAQTLAVEHPERVRSLTSIMSSTGSRRNGQPRLGMLRQISGHPPAGRDAFIAHMVGVHRSIGSPGFPVDERDLVEFATRTYERGTNPAAGARHLAAINASGDRTARLRTIRAPTLVVHGLADRLVQPSGGRATAAAVPHARLLEIAGMGHDLPEAIWPQLIEAISSNAHGDR